jgi:hypothetical protein
VTRLCIFGSRDGVPPSEVMRLVRCLPSRVHVVTGIARGVDMVAWREAYVRWHLGKLAGADFFPAMWDDFRAMGRPKAAGPERNGRLPRYSDCAIGLRNNEEKWSGTDDAQQKFIRAGVPVYVFRAPWNWRPALCELFSKVPA